MSVNITWTGFVTIIVIIAACYYAIVALIYYKEEITALFNRAGKAHIPATKSLSLTTPAPADIIGATGTEQALAEPILTDHTRYQPIAAETPLSNSKNDHPASGGADHKKVIIEIRQGIIMLLEQAGRKDDSLDELKITIPAFLEGYPEMAESKYRSQINDFILEQCHSRFSFDITEDEINDLW